MWVCNNVEKIRLFNWFAQEITIKWDLCSFFLNEYGYSEYTDVETKRYMCIASIHFKRKQTLLQTGLQRLLLPFKSVRFQKDTETGHW